MNLLSQHDCRMCCSYCVAIQIFGCSAIIFLGLSVCCQFEVGFLVFCSVVSWFHFVLLLLCLASTNPRQQHLQKRSPSGNNQRHPDNHLPPVYVPLYAVGKVIPNISSFHTQTIPKLRLLQLINDQSLILPSTMTINYQSIIPSS